MMKSLTNLVVVTLIVGLSYSVEYASSIECYHCGFMLGIRCGTVLDSSKARNCSESVCSIFTMEHRGRTLVSRQCGIDLGPNYVYDPSVTYGEEQRGEFKDTWSTCDTDLCNSRVVKSMIPT